MIADMNDLQLERWLRARNKGTLVWINKHGDKIPVKDMGDEYLDNAIDYLERNHYQEEIIIDNLD